MGGDLVSLRMLVIAAEQNELDLWRRGAGMASVPVDFLERGPDAAIRTLIDGGLDICVLDGALPEAQKAAAIKAARDARPAPLLFVTAIRGTPRIEGVNGMLAKPKTLDDARRLVEICVRTKVPTRVLIVDDSSTMRGIVRKILAASRFALDVHEAAEGVAALSALRDGKFGLVFLDYNMPGFDGVETLSKIRAENPNVAVVMMTSTIDSTVAERAHKAGALDFLKKPFYPADIDAVLERYYCTW
jgi:CheY-like chemotaxis protein